MDATSFPAAILASWLVILIIGIGLRLNRHENAHGKEHWATTLLTFSCIGFGLLLWRFEESSQLAYNLLSDLIGALIGLGTAHFALRAVSHLRRARLRSQEEHQPR